MEEREAERERSMNATPFMSRLTLNAGRAAVIMRVEGVSESVRGSGLNGDWAID